MFLLFFRTRTRFTPHQRRSQPPGSATSPAAEKRNNLLVVKGRFVSHALKKRSFTRGLSLALKNGGSKRSSSGAPASPASSSAPIRRCSSAVPSTRKSFCPAHAHRARASCLPDSNPYGHDGLAHSRALSTARRALRVA